MENGVQMKSVTKYKVPCLRDIGKWFAVFLSVYQECMTSDNNFVSALPSRKTQSAMLVLDASAICTIPTLCDRHCIEVSLTARKN